MIVSQKDLRKLEKFLDNVWSRLGVDIVFTRHFKERVNDPRNNKPITVAELRKIFQDTYRKYGRSLTNLNKGELEAVLTDMSSKINIPFVLKYDARNDEMDLVSKTIMRKKNFRTSNRKYVIESRSKTNLKFNLIKRKSYEDVWLYTSDGILPTIMVKELKDGYEIYDLKIKKIEKTGVIVRDKHVYNFLVMARSKRNDPFQYLSYDKFLSKDKIKGNFSVKKVKSKSALFQYIESKYTIGIGGFEQAFGKIERKEPDEIIYDARIFYKLGMREKRKERFRKIIKSALDKLNRESMSYLSDADFVFSKISKGTNGLYFHKGKDMKIDPSSNLKDEKLVKVIIHELGHKLWYEFLSEKTKKDIEEKFNSLLRGDTSRKDKTKKFLENVEVGDIAKSIPTTKKLMKYSPYEIIEISSKEVKIQSLGPLKIGFALTPRDAVALLDVFSADDEKIVFQTDYSFEKENPTFGAEGWFPTMYSKSSHTEWFSEMFSLYVLNGLPEEPMEWFDLIISDYRR